MSVILNHAINIATTYHQGQLDKQGQPYILHPLRVGAAGKTLAEQIVGFLHDTIEDTPASLGMIRAEFDTEIMNAVRAMTRGYFANGGCLYFKQPNINTSFTKEPYFAFIHRVLQDPIARKVKINDIEDNLSRMAGLPQEEAVGLRERYLKALQILTK
jgi:(p)ppGpp synthase/HD superfamily hydrolase